MLIKSIYYLYYRFFDMHSRGEEPITGAVMAIFTTSLMLWLNIFTFWGLLRKFEITPILGSKLLWLLILIILFVCVYFFFVYKKKYEKIIQIFKNESKKKRRKNGLLVLLYIFFSILIFVLSAIYKPR